MQIPNGAKNVLVRIQVSAKFVILNSETHPLNLMVKTIHVEFKILIKIMINVFKHNLGKILIALSAMMDIL